MLQRIRDHLTGVVAWIIIGVLALVFAAWGASGVVDFGIGPGQIAATANGEQISMEQANNAWLDQQNQLQRFLNGQELPEEQRKTIQDAVLERLISRALLAERAQEQGYRVTDEQITRLIQQEPAFQVDGKYSASLAKAALAQVQLTPQQYEADMRRSQPISQLQGALRVSDFVTPKELDRIVALEDQQREVQYATYTAEDFAASVQIDDAAVQAYYAENEAQFMTPESVKLAYGELRTEQVASQVQVAEQDLRALFEENKDRYTEPEKRRARHVLIQADAPSEDTAALAKANEVLAQAKSGKNFAALAQEYSEDTGSASKGGDLGWADRNVFVGPFSDAVFSMNEGEITGPVKTQFGYHVIKLEGIQPGKARTFDEARAELEAGYRRDKAADLFADREQQLQSRLQQLQTLGTDGAAGTDAGAGSGAATTTLDKLLNEFSLASGQVETFQRGIGGGELAGNPELEEVVFSDAVLNQGEIAGPVPVSDDRVVIVKVLEHRKPQVRPLAEVREQIVETLRREQALAAARAAAEADLKRIQGGEAAEKVIADHEPQGPKLVGRNDPSVPAPIRNAAFASSRPAGEPLASVVPLDDGAAVLRVISVREGVGAMTAEAKSERAQALSARAGVEDVEAYVREIRRTAEVEKNPEVFQ